MILVQQIVLYLFATLVALAIIAFFGFMAYTKHINDYERIDYGKNMTINTLTALFWIMLLWGVIHMAIVF